MTLRIILFTAAVAAMAAFGLFTQAKAASPRPTCEQAAGYSGYLDMATVTCAGIAWNNEVKGVLDMASAQAVRYCSGNKEGPSYRVKGFINFGVRVHEEGISKACGDASESINALVAAGETK